LSASDTTGLPAHREKHPGWGASRGFNPQTRGSHPCRDGFFAAAFPVVALR